MSISYHQRHRDSHKGKDPREVLGFYYKDGKQILIWRKRKIKPYGRIDFAGFGEEVYHKKYGEYLKPLVNKKKERQLNKRMCYEECCREI